MIDNFLGGSRGKMNAHFGDFNSCLRLIASHELELELKNIFFDLVRVQNGIESLSLAMPESGGALSVI